MILAQATGQSQTGVGLGDAYTLSPGGRPVSEVFATPADLINKSAIPIVFIVAGLALFIFAFVAGFQIVMNPDSSKMKEEAQKKLGYAIGGFVLLFASFWIIQILEQVLGTTIF